MFVAMAGGVGGARLAYGLSRVLPADQLLVAVNTGDDFEYMGLAISPDVDTVCYTLAELEDLERGWGRADETWRFMDTLAALGQPGWFRLGDGDLALHVLRTQMKATGVPLSAVTRQVRTAMGVRCNVVPMTDDSVETIVETTDGALAFQDYFVRRQCQPVVRGFEYRGAAKAAANAELLDALRSPTLEGVILCPSNPWLSIAPMLAMAELRTALQACPMPRIVVSPIVGGRAIKGPAGKLMAELGLEVSALEIARHYSGIVDTIAIDRSDAAMQAQIEALGMRALVMDTVMKSRADRVRLASELLQGDWK